MRPWIEGLCAFSICLSLGCGAGGNEEAGGSLESASEPGEEASGAVDPCELLTEEEVARVVPEHDGGFVASAGGSLIEGVEAYQCSYSNPNSDVFTVIVTAAPDAERFSQIEPSASAQREIYPDTFRELQVGDRGWLSGEPDDMKVTAIQGHSVIQLELMSADAGEKVEALVELASAVAERIE